MCVFSANVPSLNVVIVNYFYTVVRKQRVYEDVFCMHTRPMYCCSIC